MTLEPVAGTSGQALPAGATDDLMACRDLRRRSGSRQILDIDRLVLERGASYLLSGANGAGKTTLLRVLAGLDAAECAEFRFDGVAVELRRYPRHLRRQIGFVHHHPFLFAMPVAANIAFGLRAASVNKSEIQERTDRAVEWAGIGSLLERAPQKLSAGERQRVALARAHALDPDLYLLDEPTANLDDTGRELVTRLIDAIAAEGRTLLIACHDRDLLGLPGVRRLHMTNGRLDGPP